MKKILFFSTGLSTTGGIERWLKTTLSFLEANEFECYTLSCFDFKDKIKLPNKEENNFCLNEKIENSFLKKIYKILFRSIVLDKISRNNNIDLIIASADSVIVSSLLNKILRRKIKLIVVIHQELSKTNFFTRVCMKAFLRYSDKVVAVSDGINTEVSKYCGKGCVVTIHNSIDIIQNNFLSNQEIDERDRHYFDECDNIFLSIGRLEKVKNYSELIMIWKRLNTKDYLLIIGDGSERNMLEKLIFDLGLLKQVFLIGQKNNVFPYIKKSKAVLSVSLFESFGMTLIESMSLGCPVISYDCDFGPREIFGLKNNIGDCNFLKNNYGYLVQNQSQSSFLDAMSDFHNSDFVKSDIRERAAAFDVNVIGVNWLNIINSI